ncbi:hypothetical protein HK102_012513 [Quaeritorhiza haematococci]|nr:hypothetical protein HK102_012513 [Quaeritorhiza haematococci]
MTTTSAPIATSASSNPPIPREIYHPLVDRNTVANFVGVGSLSNRKDFRKVPKTLNQIVSRLCQLWYLGLPHLEEIVGSLIENIARDAVMRNKLMDNDRVMCIVLGLLRSWDSIPLLMQGLACLEKLLEQARDRQLQLAWQYFLKPLWAIMNDRGCFVPRDPLVGAVLLFTPMVDTYLFNYDTPDAIHVEIRKGFDVQEAVQFLLFYFILQKSMGSSILANKLAVETLVGYLRNPVLCIRIKSIETLNYLQVRKMVIDPSSGPSSICTSDSDSCGPESGSKAETETETESSNCIRKFTAKEYERLCKFEKIAESTLPPELVDEIRNSGHSHYLSARRAFNASKSLLQTRTARDAAHVLAFVIQLTPLILYHDRRT